MQSWFNSSFKWTASQLMFDPVWNIHGSGSPGGLRNTSVWVKHIRITFLLFADDVVLLDSSVGILKSEVVVLCQKTVGHFLRFRGGVDSTKKFEMNRWLCLASALLDWCTRPLYLTKVPDHWTRLMYRTDIERSQLRYLDIWLGYLLDSCGPVLLGGLRTCLIISLLTQTWKLSYIQ